MSYLQVPRLHFAGKFQADVPTVNNYPKHYDNENFKPDDTIRRLSSLGGWNPGGSGSWRLHECVVHRVCYADGTYCDDPAMDPVIGMPIGAANSRVSGKMVDIDPYEQVTEIWGFQLNLGADADTGFTGDFEPAGYRDIWLRADEPLFDTGEASCYQSVLYLTNWKNAANSRFLNELAATAPQGKLPETLSIKFNLDGYNGNAADPLFTFGRITGSIGQYQATEPLRFVSGRALFPVAGAPFTLGSAYCVIDKSAIQIDLGNSMRVTQSGGPLTDVGKLYLATTTPDAVPVILGEINYEDTNWYAATAGVLTVPLTPDKLRLVVNRPIGVFHSASGQFLLQEHANGVWLRADNGIYRMNPGETQAAKFYVTQFGKPLANKNIKLYNSPLPDNSFVSAPYDAVPFVSIPAASQLTFVDTITTGADGTAALSMSASDPGAPRGPIDGQLYCISYGFGATLPVPGRDIMLVRVFTDYPVPTTPTWLEHVEPIFRQYANLYPVMKKVVDLSNYAAVMERLHMMQGIFQLPVTSPNYMPVTRDLSAGKLAMIRKWLQDPRYMQLDSVESLKLALQTAIELEHATIPPYLTALYSIKPDRNAEVSRLIRDVVMEEMLHMALVSNLLIAVGGSPDFVRPGFVPKYPGSLPGGLRAGLTVSLRRCSIEQIRDTFMVIEEPEDVIETKLKAARSTWPEQKNLYTIGWFYNEISAGLTALSKAGKITFGHADRQVKDWGGSGRLFAITSLEDALNAIEQIKEQGEGASPQNPGNGEGDLSHYYKFAEIVAGARLRPDGTGFSYTGAKIPFDQDGVWPMQDNPQPLLYPDGSLAKLLSGQFAQAYQSLLKGLNRTFNGEPAFLTETIGSMYELSLLAKKLMETPSGLEDGTTAGPAFRLP
ncbi:ferritin-like domain-containing protein [Chitinophaga qingshengii]|uniref:Ferritin-like protein n=1 Tax=Chitinophaga qingshengii TaxID=1569794 RepID=A0ABR7TQL8_9BACT|nr:ferritin-like protein [Chitinophaga qingshengii]MBC9932762.1 ferritin-like protein [Chitinophaga qingshengii]